MTDWIEVNLPVREMSLRLGMLLEFVNGSRFLVGGWRLSDGGRLWNCSLLNQDSNAIVKRYRDLLEGE